MTGNDWSNFGNAVPAGLGAMFAQAERIVTFTGAGVSTESGIPDFRSPGGIWDRYDPQELTYDRFLTSAESRRQYWQLIQATAAVTSAAKPNAAHRAVARLEEMGKLLAVITQNVDGLHQRAGNSPERVIELHGTMTRARCLGCGVEHQPDDAYTQLAAGVEVPCCPRCGGLLKMDVVSFGEQLPPQALRQAMAYSAACDLFCVLGSSLVVYPAAEMPLIASRAGARLAIINYTSTPHDGFADLVVRASCGEVMEAVMSYLEARR